MSKRKSLEISESLASHGLPVSTFSLICVPVVDALVFVPLPNVQTEDTTCMDAMTKSYPAVSRFPLPCNLIPRRRRSFSFFRPFLLMTFPTRLPLAIQEPGAALLSAKGKVLSARPWFVGPFGGLASPLPAIYRVAKPAI